GADDVLDHWPAICRGAMIGPKPMISADNIDRLLRLVGAREPGPAMPVNVPVCSQTASLDFSEEGLGRCPCGRHPGAVKPSGLRPKVSGPPERLNERHLPPRAFTLVNQMRDES